MKITRLAHTVLPPTVPKCDLPVSWQTQLTRRAWNKNGHGPYEEKTCDRNATYKVDGMNMCRMHAAYYVLDQLLKEKSHAS